MIKYSSLPQSYRLTRLCISFYCYKRKTVCCGFLEQEFLQGSAENIFSVGRRYGRTDKIRNFKKSEIILKTNLKWS